jgi:hypothetical protein
MPGMTEGPSSEQTLLCDCGDPDCPGRVPVRHPFAIGIDMISDNTSDAELYLTVRTTSWEFNGERTDLHDLFSLLWAAALRARGCFGAAGDSAQWLFGHR